MTGLSAVWNHVKAQLLVDGRSKNCPLESACSNSRSQEESLEQRLVHAEAGPNLSSKSRCPQTVGGILNTLLRTRNIAADRSQAASWIFDQRAYHHVCSHITGLDGLHKLSIAVVNHADNIRLYALHKRD